VPSETTPFGWKNRWFGCEGSIWSKDWIHRNSLSFPPSSALGLTWFWVGHSSFVFASLLKKSPSDIHRTHHSSWLSRMLISASEAQTMRNDGPIFMYVSRVLGSQHNVELCN